MRKEKIDIYSDWHLDIWQCRGVDIIPEKSPDTEVAIFAGDAGNGYHWSGKVIEILMKKYTTVVRVFGNHCHYGGIVSTIRRGDYSGQVAVTLPSGLRVVGCTLWTNFRDSNGLGANAKYAERFISDFCQIEYMSAENMIELHERDVKFLRSFAEEGKRPHVVVTHFSPSLLSMDPKFTGKPLNPYFINDMDSLVKEIHPKVWVHGHNHNPVDSIMNFTGDTESDQIQTRLVCEPFGYPGERFNVPQRKEIISYPKNIEVEFEP